MGGARGAMQYQVTTNTAHTPTLTQLPQSSDGSLKPPEAGRSLILLSRQLTSLHPNYHIDPLRCAVKRLSLGERFPHRLLGGGRRFDVSCSRWGSQKHWFDLAIAESAWRSPNGHKLSLHSRSQSEFLSQTQTHACLLRPE